MLFLLFFNIHFWNKFIGIKIQWVFICIIKFSAISLVFLGFSQLIRIANSKNKIHQIDKKKRLLN
ncbi:MAG: hypothetical protein A2W86_10640 [Bacteroidetes bacterium GWD2_45_23]|nr:MAG: hypothetical protein A2W87_10595 [Bacteroidetes bacterium GWC2_46_850]OFX85074.1 MAG: hypothetical protein A2W86_10640 [Bacteroidetes bacterium GWD2_45_23]HBB00387.1 hypothetical protein [Porphyromonadaceae bacterium]HCC18414.1 hypothetical protein [Porphyromonadaceae bacterium]